MSNNELFKAAGFDLGSTNGKFSLYSLNDGIVVAWANHWFPYAQAEISYDNGRIAKGWPSGIVAANLATINDIVNGYRDSIGVTGVTGTALTVIGPDDTPWLMVYDKPPLYLNSQTSAYRGVPLGKDKSYNVQKLAALAVHLPEILEAIGKKNVALADLRLEPFISTIARSLADLKFNQGPGFFPDEHNGATGVKGSFAGHVRQVFDKMGYLSHQYVVRESGEFPEYNLLVGGDFATVLRYVKTAREAKKLPVDGVYVELDSNAKIYTWGVHSNILSSHNVDASYLVDRDYGASANPRLLAKFFRRDIAEDMQWYQEADDAAKKALDRLNKPSNPYFFYADKTSGESRGRIFQTQLERFLTLEELISLKDSEQQLVVASVYAGVACALRHNLEQIRDETGRNEVLLHGGLLSNPDQKAKREIFAAVLNPGNFDVTLLDLPDPSEMIALQAAGMVHGFSIRDDTPIEASPMTSPLNLEQYFQRWLAYEPISSLVVNPH